MKYLYFSAPWCGPCRMFGPIMDKVGTQVTVEKINVDENQEMSSKYSVRSIPTTILVNESGEEMFRQVGPSNEHVLVEAYKEHTNV
jgi:thioredoxin 1